MQLELDAHVGLRVPEAVKRHWVHQAQTERRTLSNWIICQLEKLELLEAKLAKEERTKSQRPVQRTPHNRRVA